MREENVIQETRERALLVGVDTGEEQDFDRCMEELGSLAKACEMDVVGLITQKMESVNKAYYIGTGKVAEVKEYAAECEADIIIFDNALSPSQIRNLQDAIDMPILDRTTLILDIFAIRAQTREAKLQVETARLQYLLPRLVGMHEALSRQGGASGSMSNKGTGEKKLELDRRKIEHRISELKKELEVVEQDRHTQRKRRRNSRIPQVALVGYTNAGKSTVLNQMVEQYVGNGDKKVLQKDMLFATLETSVRSIDTGDNKPFFLVDTVGFIHKLPHNLIDAFRATLEELEYADLLLHVIDLSNPNWMQQAEVVRRQIHALGLDHTPVIEVFNKADLVDAELMPHGRDMVVISALTGAGMTDLMANIARHLGANRRRVLIVLPYDQAGRIDILYRDAKVEKVEYLPDRIEIQAIVEPRTYGWMRDYIKQDWGVIS